MAPSIVSNCQQAHRVEEDDVLDAEIMKAIRNSLKELNITSPSRPSRPPPGAVAEDEYPGGTGSEGNSPQDEEISMVTKASDIEKDLQESLREILIIREKKAEFEADFEAENDLTDEDEVSQATLASNNDDKSEEKSEKSEMSTVYSTTSQKKYDLHSVFLSVRAYWSRDHKAFRRVRASFNIGREHRIC